MDIKEKIKTLPTWSGVYFFKDKNGKIIYVGKARNLKKRVVSYFVRSHVSTKTTLLVRNIVDVDFILTGSEEEALIYEASFIKKYMPRYNAALKDDKSYPLLRLSLDEDFPRLCVVRKPKKDKALYYGPYTDVKLLRNALKIMQKMFPLHTCNIFPKTHCLMFDLGLCQAPCEGRVTKKEYRRIVKDVQYFLEGEKDLLIKRLSKQMQEHAKKREYEKAAMIRDQIVALTRVSISAESDKSLSILNLAKNAFRLKYAPLRIEAFDISNIQGKWAVGSMVCFENAVPNRNQYRKFKIKLVKRIDDYAMMREVLKRRYSGELSFQLKLPDLILIDGGRGHLSAAQEVMYSLNLQIPLISIAKKEELIFLANKKTPLRLSPQSDVRKLMQRIRDEAHRFAVTYHRYLRKKSHTQSILEEIPGIGTKIARQILDHYETLDALKEAQEEDLLSIQGINQALADKIIAFFKEK